MPSSFFVRCKNPITHSPVLSLCISDIEVWFRVAILRIFSVTFYVWRMEIFVQFKVNSLILIFAFCVRIRFCLAIDADFSGRRID